jgi:hypothetical protein
MIPEESHPLRREMEKRMQEIKKVESEQPKQEKRDINLFLLKFNINDITGELVIGAPTISDAVTKFIAVNKEQSSKWRVVRLEISETAVL